jgi:hypothetical protein
MGRMEGIIVIYSGLFLNSQADVYKIERFGPSEEVIYVRSPVSNLNVEGNLLYQIMMLMIGGPVLELRLKMLKVCSRSGPD